MLPYNPIIHIHDAAVVAISEGVARHRWTLTGRHEPIASSSSALLTLAIRSISFGGPIASQLLPTTK